MSLGHGSESCPSQARMWCNSSTTDGSPLIEAHMYVSAAYTPLTVTPTDATSAGESPGFGPVAQSGSRSDMILPSWGGTEADDDASLSHKDRCSVTAYHVAAARPLRTSLALSLAVPLPHAASLRGGRAQGERVLAERSTRRRVQPVRSLCSQSFNPEITSIPPV